MSLTVCGIVAVRLKGEEGKRPRAYNDATGRTVSCKPGGNLSIGYGVNLETGLDQAEMEFLLNHRIGLADSALTLRAPWYANLCVSDPTKASIYLDVAYNAGVDGLLHGFPTCCKYAEAGDWTHSAAELTVADANLDHSRYEPLRKILLAGIPAL